MVREESVYLQPKEDEMMKHILIILLTALLLLGCKQSTEDLLPFILEGAWTLKHAEYPIGKEDNYTMEGSGTFCHIYDGDSMLYECRVTTTSSGLVILPTAKRSVKLLNKGGGEWLYLEDGDPHPLTVSDTIVTIQYNGVLYSWVRANDLYNEWGKDMRDIITNDVKNKIEGNHSYVLSARERRQASYIQWLVTIIGLLAMLAIANYLDYRRRRRQLQLQLQQIQEVQQNRPQAVRQVVATVENSFFASDEYAALQRRMASGQLMKEEEWWQVEQYLKTLYPGFTSQLRSLYPMSELEYHVCLLIKLHIAPTDIAAVLARDVSTISTMRNRLYKKVFGRKGGAKEWDEFILSIGV